MIFAELEYPQHYDELHQPLVALLESHFDTIESGQQGDSWIWIFDGDEKVEIDTFYSMKHQVKAAHNGPLVQQVIKLLEGRFSLRRYQQPEPEPHE